MKMDTIIKIIQPKLMTVLISGIALTASTLAAIWLKQPETNFINSIVNNISSESSGFIDNVAMLLPLGFAFTAGMVTAVNPCGFAMLLAYLGLYLGFQKEHDIKGSLVTTMGSGMIVGTSVTAGFVTLFGIAGIIVSIGSQTIIASMLPWLGVLTGVIIVIAGAWIHSGDILYTTIAPTVASRIGDQSQTNVRGYFLFGVSYGTASLGCTLPIFLAVVGTSLTISDIRTSLNQFLFYALGMGTTILFITIGMILFNNTLTKSFAKVVPVTKVIGTSLMIVSGSYIVFYWLTTGGLL